MNFQSKSQNFNMQPVIFLFAANILSSVNQIYNPFELSQEQLNTINYSIASLNTVLSVYSYFSFSFEKQELLNSFSKEQKKFFYKTSNEIHKAFLKMIKNPKTLKVIPDPSFFEQLFAIYNSPEAIKYIKNPSEYIQKFAIQMDITTIKWIKNLDIKLKLDTMKKLYEQGFDLGHFF